MKTKPTGFAVFVVLYLWKRNHQVQAFATKESAEKFCKSLKHDAWQIKKVDVSW